MRIAKPVDFIRLEIIKKQLNDPKYQEKAIITIANILTAEFTLKKK